ncbi:MAG: glycosyltransferase family 2 protein, partial [Burkholderiaceae bacterium]|nr:glycosyltransferase family 2 protein [Burkholderiaceae bacterium]
FSLACSNAQGTYYRYMKLWRLHQMARTQNPKS